MGNGKILIICGPLDYGGAGKIIKFVVNHLINKGWDITVYSLYQKERPQSLDKRIEYIGKDGAGDKRYRILHWRLDELLQIRMTVKKENPDIVCSFVSDCVFMSRLATLGLRSIIFVGAERGDPYTLPSKWKMPITWAYKHCDYCIFQLQKQALFFGKDIMIKSFVIANPFIPQNDLSTSNTERKKTIVSAGRFEYQKGYDVLIKAYAKVHNNYPDYKLIIYGSGPLLDEYKELAKLLGVSDYIEYPGYVSNVAEAVKNEGIFVLPSRFEGIPNALIEALSTGIPTISADCTPGGPDFLTNHGNRGILVKVDDVEETANAIIYMIENPSKAIEYGKKGQEVIQELEPSRIAKQWEMTFSRIKKNTDNR